MFHNIKLYLIAVCAFMMSITASFGIVCNAPWVPNANDDACVCNDILYNGNCIESKFEIETTPIATGDYFAFQIQSKGEFYVDWGDGYVEPLTASLDTVTLKTYAHKYTGTTQSYRIKFGGRATSYYVDYSNNRPVIMFGSLAARAPDNTTDVATVNASNVRTKLYKIYGSLGRIFSGIPGEQMFYGTFAGCSNLVGTDIPDPNNPGMNYAIPPTLFDGVAGRPMAGMFTSTFSGCSSLTGSIPANLFSGISGQPAYQMFTSTFSGCSGLTGSIPETLV